MHSQSGRFFRVTVAVVVDDDDKATAPVVFGGTAVVTAATAVVVAVVVVWFPIVGDAVNGNGKGWALFEPLSPSI